jgi:hypothetical protein
VAEFDSSTFENIAERDRLAANFDAAYPVGLSWAVHDDRVIGPIITVGFPDGMNRGVVALAAADSGWSVYAVGPAAWFPKRHLR